MVAASTPVYGPPDPSLQVMRVSAFLAWKDGQTFGAAQALLKQKHLRSPANQDQPKGPLQTIELSDRAVCALG
jgi:hypothetical protein